MDGAPHFFWPLDRIRISGFTLAVTRQLVDADPPSPASSKSPGFNLVTRISKIHGHLIRADKSNLHLPLPPPHHKTFTFAISISSDDKPVQCVPDTCRHACPSLSLDERDWNMKIDAQQRTMGIVPTLGVAA